MEKEVNLFEVMLELALDLLPIEENCPSNHHLCIRVGELTEQERGFACYKCWFEYLEEEARGRIYLLGE